MLACPVVFQMESVLLDSECVDMDACMESALVNLMVYEEAMYAVLWVAESV